MYGQTEDEGEAFNDGVGRLFDCVTSPVEPGSDGLDNALGILQGCRMPLCQMAWRHRASVPSDARIAPEPYTNRYCLTMLQTADLEAQDLLKVTKRDADHTDFL